MRVFAGSGFIDHPGLAEDLVAKVPAEIFGGIQIHWQAQNILEFFLKHEETQPWSPPGLEGDPVSYTHLTLPTILRV